MEGWRWRRSGWGERKMLHHPGHARTHRSPSPSRAQHPHRTLSHVPSLSCHHALLQHGHSSRPCSRPRVRRRDSPGLASCGGGLPALGVQQGVCNKVHWSGPCARASAGCVRTFAQLVRWMGWRRRLAAAVQGGPWWHGMARRRRALRPRRSAPSTWWKGMRAPLNTIQHPPRTACPAQHPPRLQHCRFAHPASHSSTPMRPRTCRDYTPRDCEGREEETR